MARDATARLYDVDEDSIVYEKLTSDRGKYEDGAISFRAKKGRFVDLDKLHESIWATRLSGGTRSRVLSLEVTVQGEVVVEGDQATVRLPESNQYFVLATDPGAETKEGAKTALERLREAVGRGEKVTKVTGCVEGWRGGWPEVLNKPPAKPPRVFVTSFETASP